ncbi:outer membrane protein [Labrys miyagiensis]|uniref:outer membrane protein n=1 Tax=Labrys miyagiensis TaxID=346912 RepID=UPI0024E16126|nr:outer membrane protein [Labrys miyagiensis]
MKNLLLAAAFFAISSSSFAADLAPQAAEPAAPVVLPFSWTGFYVGLHAGADFGSAKVKVPIVPIHATFSGTGFLGGAHVGYNQQFDGDFVLGVEGDIDYSSLSKTRNIGSRVNFKNEWQGSVRARAGYAFGNLLPYVTGGVAFGDVKFVSNGVTAISDTRVGWTVGGGLEYAIDQNWLVRGEVRYVDLGEKGSIVPGAVRVKTSFDSVNATLGVSYRF